MIDVCILTNVKWKKVLDTLQDYQVPFHLRHLRKDPWTLQEFQSILRLTQEGLDDIISYNGKSYQTLQAQGIQFEALRLQEVHELIVHYPSLLKLPLTTDYQSKLGIGTMGAIVFEPRTQKKIQFLHSHEKAQQLEAQEVHSLVLPEQC